MCLFSGFRRHVARVTAAVLLAAGWFCALATSSCPAATIRDDVGDEPYLALASQSQYDCVGRVSGGTGVLIRPDWMLTAGHLMGTSTFTIHKAGVTTTYSTVAGSAVRFPDEDIALVQLTEPVADVAPARLFDASMGSELGRVGTFVGLGQTGTGLTGDTKPGGTKRAGNNMIDTDGTEWFDSPAVLLTDFDNPRNPADNRMGSPTPLSLEIGSAHGDSGGGLFIEQGGRMFLAGIQVRLWYVDGTADADYGDGGVFVRVTTFRDWLAATLPTPLPGDANYDGRVDRLDAAVLAAHWLAAECVFWEDGDFNTDGRVDDLDASILAAHWQAESPLACGVPEPAGWASAGLLGLGFLLWRVTRSCVPRLEVDLPGRRD